MLSKRQLDEAVLLAMAESAKIRIGFIEAFYGEQLEEFDDAEIPGLPKDSQEEVNEGLPGLAVGN